MLIHNKIIKRRHFIKASGMALLSTAAAPFLHSSTPELDLKDRMLSFYNTHTHERLKSCYFQNNHFSAEALSKIDYILRDFRTGEIKEIDRKLLDLLFILKQKLGIDSPFHVISGYRSSKTNEMLRQTSSGIAKNSLHILGQAIDIRVPGLPLEHLCCTAIDLKAGGVGFYPDSDFIHVDIGRIRYW